MSIQEKTHIFNNLPRYLHYKVYSRFWHNMALFVVLLTKTKGSKNYEWLKNLTYICINVFTGKESNFQQFFDIIWLYLLLYNHQISNEGITCWVSGAGWADGKSETGAEASAAGQQAWKYQRKYWWLTHMFSRPLELIGTVFLWANIRKYLLH